MRASISIKTNRVIMKKIYAGFLFLWILLVFSIETPLYSQTAFQGFNRTQFDRLLRTNKCPGCYLYHAKLSYLDLTGADLRGAALSGAKLRYATLRDADLKGALISGANFSGADLSGAIWVDGRRCPEGSIGTCKKQ